LEQHLAVSGNRCPVTDEILQPDDIITLKLSAAATPAASAPAATSFPSLLHLLQSEWDHTVLQLHNSKRQLDQTRQELANALYENDAAARVIARLLKERDAAREALVQLQVLTGAPVNDDEQGTGMTEQLVERMTAHSKILSQQRRQRAINPPSVESVAALQEQVHFTPHKVSDGAITCMTVDPAHPQRVATGGQDHNIVVVNYETGRKEQTLVGHSKPVTAICGASNFSTIISGSKDKSIRIWKAGEAGAPHRCRHVIQNHTGAVTGVSLHPLANYFATSSLDKSWSFHDLERGTTLTSVKDAEHAYHSCTVHPDGLILGTGGADGVVRMWDLKSQQNVANFTGHVGNVTTMAFSENGYFLASAATDDVLRLWDLRKLQNPNVQTYQFEQGFGVRSLSLDFSGVYLAAGGKDIQLFVTKTLDPIATISSSSTDPITAVQWATSPHSTQPILLSGSSDRHLRVFRS